MQKNVDKKKYTRGLLSLDSAIVSIILMRDLGAVADIEYVQYTLLTQ